MKTVSEKVRCQKIDKYYFKDHKGRIRKNLQFCRRKNCKTESSCNYKNLKPKNCFKHKKENIVNTKRGHKLCLNCKSSYKTKCSSPKCKYTIEKYKSASKYMKLKTIDYLKENKIEYHLCRICQEFVSKSHFDSEEHIKKFNSVCDIEIKNLLKMLLFQSNLNYLIQDIIIYTQSYHLKTYKRYNIKKYCLYKLL